MVLTESERASHGFFDAKHAQHRIMLTEEVNWNKFDGEYLIIRFKTSANKSAFAQGQLLIQSENE